VSTNNKRKKAARNKQRLDPGLSYMAAWNAAGAEQAARDRAAVDDWDAVSDRLSHEFDAAMAASDDAMNEAGDGLRYRFHPGISARFEASGVMAALTALDIDQAVIDELSLHELAAAITDVIARTEAAAWAASLGAMDEHFMASDPIASDPDGSEDSARAIPELAERTFVERSRDGRVEVGVGHDGRFLWCLIGVSPESGGQWHSDQLSQRITALRQVAAMTAAHHNYYAVIGTTTDDAAVSIPDWLPSVQTIAEYRATHVTF
jgi:hypothetical protein